MPIYPLIILISLPTLFYWLYPPATKIDVYGFFFPEFIMASIVLVCMHYLWRMKCRDNPNKYLFNGFSILFTALYIDCLDELFQIPRLFIFLFEDLFQVVGLLLIVMGIRLWLKVQESQNQSLTKLANTDPLTGCFTRRYFIRQFESLVKNDKNRCCILLIDVDHFKKINDTYGHNAGDQVLVHFTELLKHNLRSGDIVARWGGEEFIVLLPQIALTTGLKKAESLRQKIQETTVKLEQQTLSITASIGVVEYTQELNTLEKLIEVADQHLYRAKSQGRNLVFG